MSFFPSPRGRRDLRDEGGKQKFALYKFGMHPKPTDRTTSFMLTSKFHGILVILETGEN